MTASCRVVVLTILFLPVRYADAQVPPWPGDWVQSVPPPSQELRRLRQERCIQEVRKSAQEAQRREFTCPASALDMCFNMYWRRMEFDQEQEKQGLAKCLW